MFSKEKFKQEFMMEPLEGELTVESAAKVAASVGKKTFADVKTDYGVVLVQGKLYYGCHLRGTLTEKSKTAFSVLSSTIDDVDDIKLDTFIFGQMQGTDLALAEIDTSDLYNWFFNSSATATLPALSKEVKAIVLKDINKWKGMYEGGHSTFAPLTTLSDELAEPIITSNQYAEMCTQLQTLGVQLASELAKIKKDLQGIGLEGFIDRYAFKEHVLVSGPSGASKTYTVDKFVTDNGFTKEFIAGHEAIESTDLLGYPIRHIDGSFVWMDGPLTAAFRNAQVEKNCTIH